MTIQDVENIIDKNFYEVDREFFLQFKKLNERLSCSYLNFNEMNEEDFLKEAAKLLVYFSKNLFHFLTEENSNKIKSNVVFDISKSEAYCSLTENFIFIGTNILLNKNLPKQLRLDTLISTLFHEFYHKKYTIKDILINCIKTENKEEFFENEEYKSFLKILFEKNGFKHVFNIFEDKRIERIGAKDFPGNSFYFDEARKCFFYLALDVVYLEDDYLNIIDYLKYKILLPEFLPYFFKQLKIAKENTAGFLKEKSISKDKKENVYEIIKKIDKLLDQNKKLVDSKNILDTIKITNDILQILPKELLEELGKGENHYVYNETTENCQISKEEIEEINKLFNEEISGINEKNNISNSSEKFVIPNLKNENSGSYDVVNLTKISNSKIDTEILNAAKKFSKDFTEIISSLNEKFDETIEIFEQIEGEIDEDELYSINFNKLLFKDDEEKTKFSISIGILLDQSSSMSGIIKDAKIALCGILLAFKNCPFINLYIYGHSADSINGQLDMFKYFDSSDNKKNNQDEWKNIFAAKSERNNADGYAIKFMEEVMKKESDEKILIVISDGIPSANKYKNGIEHTHKVVQELKKKNITTIQICMADFKNSNKMFEHFIPYEEGKFFEKLSVFLKTKLISRFY